MRRHPRDRDLQQKVDRPGYRIVQHPRKFSKPLRCQAGIHAFGTKVIQGVLHLVCKKCGAGIAEGLYDRTWTKGDMRKIKLMQRTREPGMTEDEHRKKSLKDSWEALELLRKKFTDDQIKRMMKKRRLQRMGPR